MDLKTICIKAREETAPFLTLALLSSSFCRGRTAHLIATSSIPPSPLGVQHCIGPVLLIFLSPSFLTYNITIFKKPGRSWRHLTLWQLLVLAICPLGVCSVGWWCNFCFCTMFFVEVILSFQWNSRQVRILFRSEELSWFQLYFAYFIIATALGFSRLTTTGCKKKVKTHVCLPSLCDTQLLISSSHTIVNQWYGAF